MTTSILINTGIHAVKVTEYSTVMDTKGEEEIRQTWFEIPSVTANYRVFIHSKKTIEIEELPLKTEQ